jgi:glycosyltransferase involved in cell wall biosynthesis
MWTRVLVLKEMGYCVDLLATVNEMPNEDLMQTVRQHVGSLWIVLRRRSLTSVLSFLPFQVLSRIGLKDVVLDQHYDAIVLESEYVAAILKNPGVRQAKLILRVHNEQVGYFREFAEGSANWLKKLYYYSESFKFRFLSPAVMRKSDLLWFISSSERQYHVRENPQDDTKSFFVPTHVEPTTMHACSAMSRTALFIGTLTISHNSDAVQWYVEKVHPLLSDLDDYVFQVAGRTAGQPIPALKQLVQHNENVSLEEDPIVLDGLYGGAGVFVNPVICGAGVKVKVIQALQAGMPIVSTSMGVEGTGFEDSKHLLIADTPQEFAASVRRLMTEPELRESLVRNAQAFLSERYDMKCSMQKVLAEAMSATN